MRADLFADWPALSQVYPFLNPSTVGEFSRAEINGFIDHIKEMRWQQRG